MWRLTAPMLYSETYPPNRLLDMSGTVLTTLTTVDTNTVPPTVTTYVVKDVIVVSVPPPNEPAGRRIQAVYDVAKLSYPYSGIYKRMNERLSESCWSEVVYGGNWGDKKECEALKAQLEAATLCLGYAHIRPEWRVVGVYDYPGYESHTKKPWVFRMNITQREKVVETNHYLLQQHPGVESARGAPKLLPDDLLQVIAAAKDGSSEAAAIGGGSLFTEETLRERKKVLEASKLPPNVTLGEYYVAIERTYFRPC